MPRLAALLMLSCLAGLPARAASDKPPQTVGVESPSPNVGPDEPLDEEDESADEGGDTVVAGEEDTETPEVRRELDEHLRELEEEHRAEELSLPAIGAEPRNLRLLGPANPLRQRSDDDLGRDGVLVDEPGSPPAPIGVEPGDPLDELGGLDLPSV
ncbi:MAG: hypothetical protein RL199_1464, partial [Pseudomonadota bacterium]